jgi:hypothetical protein
MVHLLVLGPLGTWLWHIRDITDKHVKEIIVVTQ